MSLNFDFASKNFSEQMYTDIINNLHFLTIYFYYILKENTILIDIQQVKKKI